MSSTTFISPVPKTKIARVTFPAPHVLLVTLQRPSALNAINTSGSWELDALYSWLDDEPSLWLGIVTGEGRAFCAGADLKEWNDEIASGAFKAMPPSGFGGLSRRGGKKPIIAAVNGLAYGGGFEMVVNSDLVVASPSATFAFPEVRRGVTPFAGALPRVVRTVGKQRAMEIVLGGRILSAQEAKEWGLVNLICADMQSVVDQALQLASTIVEGSPDAITVARQGINWGWEGVGADDATRICDALWSAKLQKGDNIKEGLAAFVEKRKPVWGNSKL